MDDPGEDEIEAAILALVTERGIGKTICPSEVARALGGSAPETWRPLMAPVKRVAARLARDGQIAVLRGGVPVPDLAALRGIYRIGSPRGRGRKDG